jgi:protein-S-isoprenylcysteine O-methyltransferase Ste14
MGRDGSGDDVRAEPDERVQAAEPGAPEPTLRGAGSRLGELAVFLAAVIGAIALGLGISAYLREHPYVVAYLLAYAGFRIADVMLDEGDREARTDARPRWGREVAILALFAAAPFERTYVYGGEAPEGAAAFGLLMELAGLWLVIGSRVQLRMGAGREGNVVVRTGFYRYVRHPVRAGAMLVLFAWPFEYGAPVSAAVTFAVLLFGAARAIRREESAMLARFGAEYESYRRETERLLPNIW